MGGRRGETACLVRVGCDRELPTACARAGGKVSATCCLVSALSSLLGHLNMEHGLRAVVDGAKYGKLNSEGGITLTPLLSSSGTSALKSGVTLVRKCSSSSCSIQSVACQFHSRAEQRKGMVIDARCAHDVMRCHARSTPIQGTMGTDMGAHKLLSLHSKAGSTPLCVGYLAQSSPRMLCHDALVHVKADHISHSRNGIGKALNVFLGRWIRHRGQLHHISNTRRLPSSHGLEIREESVL